MCFRCVLDEVAVSIFNIYDSILLTQDIKKNSMCFGALYFTEMLQIIIINCYQWLSTIIINGYQL